MKIIVAQLKIIVSYFLFYHLCFKKLSYELKEITSYLLFISFGEQERNISFSTFIFP